MLVIQRRGDGTLTTVPWLDRGRGGLELPEHAVPTRKAAEAVAASALTLPWQFSKPWVDRPDHPGTGDVPGRMPGRSRNAPWLAGELLLVLDEDCQTRLSGFDIRYSQSDGLLVTPAGCASHKGGGPRALLRSGLPAMAARSAPGRDDGRTVAAGRLRRGGRTPAARRGRPHPGIRPASAAVGRAPRRAGGPRGHRGLGRPVGSPEIPSRPCRVTSTSTATGSTSSIRTTPSSRSPGCARRRTRRHRSTGSSPTCRTGRRSSACANPARSGSASRRRLAGWCTLTPSTSPASSPGRSAIRGSRAARAIRKVSGGQAISAGSSPRAARLRETLLLQPHLGGQRLPPGGQDRSARLAPTAVGTRSRSSPTSTSPARRARGTCTPGRPAGYGSSTATARSPVSSSPTVTRSPRTTCTNREPMTGWRRSDATGEEARLKPVYMPRQHDPSRAAWRGLAALLGDQGQRRESAEQRQEAESSLPPRVVEWLRAPGERGLPAPAGPHPYPDRRRVLRHPAVGHRRDRGRRDPAPRGRPAR